jgi:hypothetical protein
VVGLGVIVGEVVGQVTVGVDLGEHVFGRLLDNLHGVAGREAQEWLNLAFEVDQRVGEFGGDTSLLAVHALPGSDGLLEAPGVSSIEASA